tara:strand:+ start:242 stop:484 length:243 start_codon:yes stop_codon:yes gene_type:complete
MTNLNSKRFVIRKSLLGKNQTINVQFKNGKTCTYSHDKVYEIMKNTLTNLPCWLKYKSYTSSTGVPISVRNTVEVLKPTV